MAKGAKKKVAPGDVATNRQAAFRYHLIDRIEAGIVLQGTEVKALRDGKAQIKDAFASLRDGELWLHNLHIPPYNHSRDNHEPERPRKLLLHRREIDRLGEKVSQKGLTIVPTRIYFSGARAKVEIALARGKDHVDKRETIKGRDIERETQRAIRDYQRR